MQYYLEQDILKRWPNAENALNPFPPGSNTRRLGNDTPRKRKPSMHFYDQDADTKSETSGEAVS